MFWRVCRGMHAQLPDLANVESLIIPSGESMYIPRNTTVFTSPLNPLPSSDQFEKDITFFIACYNEADNIIASLEAVVASMACFDWSWEIILIDDASQDNSVQLVRQYLADHPDYSVFLLVREKNQGLAQNFIEAAFVGSGKYYRLINGDNVESTEQITSILRHIGEAEILIPYHAEVYGRTLFRRGLSLAFTFIVNMLSGYHIKYYNGCSVHLRHDVMRWHVNCSGFDFQANLITRLFGQGRTFLEIPVVGSERAFGESKALTLKNFLSATRFFIDLAFRRLWRFFKK